MYHLSLLEMSASISKHFFKHQAGQIKHVGWQLWSHSELHPRETQSLPAVSFPAPEISYSSLSMNKKIINQSLQYAISSLCTFLPLQAGIKKDKQENPALFSFGSNQQHYHLLEALWGLRSADTRMPQPETELLLHLVPECQTTATTGQDTSPAGPPERGPHAGAKPGFETSASELGAMAGLRECVVMVTCNFQNHLHPLEIYSMGLKSFLS